MDKPKIVGMAILELSKTVMYEFLYDFMKKEFSDFDLCYMDTDSFFLHIRTDDVYKDLAPQIERFDTSPYDKKDVPFEKGLRKKVIGLMEDESGDFEITEGVWNCAKSYGYIPDGDEEDLKKKAMSNRKLKSKRR